MILKHTKYLNDCSKNFSTLIKKFIYVGYVFRNKSASKVQNISYTEVKANKLIILMKMGVIRFLLLGSLKLKEVKLWMFKGTKNVYLLFIGPNARERK